MAKQLPPDKYNRRAFDRASRVIRRLAAGHCERCKRPCTTLSVHHIGAPRPTGRGWKNGDPCDKHDLRRENLAALCWSCHCASDEPIKSKCTGKRAKREAKRAAHRALGVGTGLVVVVEVV
jgi:hypothetical protein